MIWMVRQLQKTDITVSESSKKMKHVADIMKEFEEGLSCPQE